MAQCQSRQPGGLRVCTENAEHTGPHLAGGHAAGIQFWVDKGNLEQLNRLRQWVRDTSRRELAKIRTARRKEDRASAAMRIEEVLNALKDIAFRELTVEEERQSSQKLEEQPARIRSIRP